MRTIEKGDEPASLRRYRKSGGETWEDYKEKDDARHALLKEQGHICCFCMGRISLRGMKIAHWAPQSQAPGERLSWGNLLGACMGGDGGPREGHHCDTAQGDTPIKVHPGDRTQRCERLIRYRPNGRIESDDPEINKDLHETLRLNLDMLMVTRQKVYDTLLARLKKLQPEGHWPPEMIEAELAEWKSRDKDGKARPFCQVAIYFLEKKLPKQKA